MTFYKYQGTGNDFILIDNRVAQFHLAGSEIAMLCHRRFGIGADGLMLLEEAPGYDFRMVYYNADGGESTMCGNGGRCITAFAHHLGIIKSKARFVAIDGVHNATIFDDGMVSLEMNDVDKIDIKEGFTILNTGSPHYVKWVDEARKANVFADGRRIRNEEEFRPGGINVNFVERQIGKLYVRTYERGVEDETLSCGTGVVAAAIAATGLDKGNHITEIETPGGALVVSFTKDTPHTAKNIVLTGPAVKVFKGEISL